MFPSYPPPVEDWMHSSSNFKKATVLGRFLRKHPVCRHNGDTALSIAGNLNGQYFRHGPPQRSAHRRNGTPQTRARWGWPERLGPYREGHWAASRGQKPTVSNGVKTNENCRFKTHWKRRRTNFLSLSVGIVFSHPAGIRAKFDFIPDLFPLLTPHKGSTANDTWLGGQVGFLPHLGHPNTSTAIGVKSTG